jgi:hypothetical protein
MCVEALMDVVKILVELPFGDAIIFAIQDMHLVVIGGEGMCIDMEDHQPCLMAVQNFLDAMQKSPR